MLFTLNDSKAEVTWRIESGEFDASWRPLSGRRYDDDTNAYVDEAIPGWRARFESVDDRSANGSPSAITISVTTAP